MWIQNNRYGYTEAVFACIRITFPLVAEPVKVAAFSVCRDAERELVK